MSEQYESDGDPVLFRCRECGRIEQSLGALHAHIETHRGYTRVNIQLPFTASSPGDFEELMNRTEVLRVSSVHTISLSDLDGL